MGRKKRLAPVTCAEMQAGTRSHSVVKQAIRGTHEPDETGCTTPLRLEVARGWCVSRPPQDLRPGLNKTNQESEVKALSEEQAKQLLEQIKSEKRPPRQGKRGHRRGRQFAPGYKLSVALTHCGHRARVEALHTGYVPRRALCPKCRKWRYTKALTARRPVKSAQRIVVAERVEERDGKTFSVKVFKTPPRARF